MAIYVVFWFIEFEIFTGRNLMLKNWLNLSIRLLLLKTNNELVSIVCCYET